MNPRLAAITGPLKGKVFTLDKDEVCIGRETSTELCIPDRSVSRRHSLIKREADEFQITDLESLNSTFINGVPVKQRLLAHGDRIKIGDSLLLFLLHEEMPDATEVQFDDRLKTGERTVQVRVEEAFHLMARDLSALMKISTAISSVRGLEELKQKLLELIFEVVPAEQGAILLIGESSDDFASVFGLDRRRGPDRTVRVSRTIAQKVLHEGISILSNDVQESGAFDATESVMTTRVRSLLCLPIMLYERTVGVIYLYASAAETHFDEDHLQLLTAIASIAAAALENARHIERLESENQRLRADVRVEHNMIGESQRLREVYQFIARVAPTDSTVLITGESGTGKELVARALHQNSRRAGRAFVAVNCAALTETLLESELFGHEKGAFTGALLQKKGKLEVADGGTIFLDEVGEMNPALQAKLLRVLQEREFERVGGTRTIKVDLRVITATNRDLEEAIKQGSFRQDLFYRLNVVSLETPPLRERREDIPLLASYFAEKYGAKCNRRIQGISTEARALLLNYDWPGNVRELENAIERAVVLGSTEHILPEDLPEALLETESDQGLPATQYHEAVTELKRQLILKAMDQSAGNFTEAARLLGLHPNYLHRLIRNMNLREALK
ncbi:MAG TPA: sigma 54-interacting transcriptional regulator [Pyrinomonadaceae bacterium]|jgi:Nif-specific regulatory protein